MRRTYKPKTETRVRLTAAARNEHSLHIFFDELQRRAPKQLDLLMKYLELSGYLSGRDIKEVSKPNCCNAPLPPLPYSTVLWTVVYSKSTSRK